MTSQDWDRSDHPWTFYQSIANHMVMWSSQKYLKRHTLMFVYGKLSSDVLVDSAGEVK